MNIYKGAISLAIFGESHGEAVGVILDGIPAGTAISKQGLQEKMQKRSARGKISTARHEKDEVRIISGVRAGETEYLTTGAPVAILVANENVRSKDYTNDVLPRPSHADFVASEKYNGFADLRGGGHFSGRLTAPIVAAGYIAECVLAEDDISIGSHLLRVKDVTDRQFSCDVVELKREIVAVNDKYFPVLDENVGAKMQELASAAASAGDSVGGIVETAVVGHGIGIGEPFFDSVESVLSHLIFSIPAVKGVEFGLGFDFATQYGSDANDEFYYDNSGKIATKTNNNAGINGGITNGMPIIIKTAIKPTP
ncbi:MAG: chorismate synthase, partial [Bifidobacteriaceae bacterium]|nr:chorismate synthase [Bifidobacteriaceae bacterium]